MTEAARDQFDVIIGAHAPSAFAPTGVTSVVRLTGTDATFNDGELVISDGERIVAGFAPGGWMGWYRTESSANTALPVPEADEP